MRLNFEIQGRSKLIFGRMFFVEGHKTEKLRVEIEFDFSDGAVTMFCDN